MTKMIKDYKRDLKQLNKRIENVKHCIKHGDDTDATVDRLELLREERNDLVYAIELMSDYVQAVEKRRNGVV